MQGVPDGVVDVMDISYVMVLFGSKLGSPDWCPNADISYDCIVKHARRWSSLPQFWKNIVPDSTLQNLPAPAFVYSRFINVIRRFREPRLGN